MGGWSVYGNRAHVIAGTVVMQVLSSMGIIGRFYTRFWKQQCILASDWLVLAAFVCGTSLSIMEIYGVAINAFAVPLNATNPSLQGKSVRLKQVQHMEYAFVLLGVFSIGLIKLSVCLLYWHIFARVKFRLFLTVWIGIIAAWTVCFVVAEILECGKYPLKVFGTRKDIEQYCPYIHEIGYALVASDVATDLITLLIPIPLIVKMRLPTTRKLLVAATFLIGALAVGASSAKAYVYIAATKALIHEDGIILVTAYSMWNLVEIHVGIIAACGMTLRPIIDRIIPFERIIERCSSLLSSKRGTAHTGETLPSFVQIRSHSDRSSEIPTDEKKETESKTPAMQFQTSAIPEVV